MKRIVLFVMFAVLVSACGSAETAAPAAESPVTTTAEAITTTTTPAATTTRASAPATAVQEGGVSSQLAAVRAAMAGTAEIRSARMEGLIEMTGIADVASVTISFPFSGAFDSVTGNSSFTMDLSSMAAVGGEEIPADFADLFGEMEVREIDGTSYIRFPFFGMMFGAQTPWISAPADEGDSLASGFTFGQPDDPTGVLSDFENADAEVTELGREMVNGVDTTHYRVLFDTAKLLDEASPEERERLEDRGFVPAGTLPTDIWISDDGYVVRYVMDVDGTAVAHGDGDEFERMVMRFDLLDINQPVQIVAPDLSEVTDISGLAGMFGGMSSG
jgi:hypothetical protein